MSKLKKAIITTKIILFIVTTGLIAYDITVLAKGTDDATISFQTTTISEHFILIPVAWGVLAFHFFGSKLGKKLFGKIPKLRYAIWIPASFILLVLCIVNLFKPIPFIVFMENYLLIPLFLGQFLGLFWYQDKKG